MIRLALPPASGRLRAALLSLFLLAVACDAPTIPEGLPGTVEVLAFVDEDGSGTFNPGTDQPIAGATLRLIASGGASVGEATTAADGIARFTGVRPGGYAVELAGPIPDGVELATAVRPVLAVPAQGGAVQTSFRFVSRPSALEGLVYRDLSGSGAFDPLADERGEGFLVELFRGNAATGDAQAQMRTGEDGSFAFPNLRSGAWTVRISPPPPLEVVGEPVRTVTLAAGQTSRLEVAYTGQFLLDVASARLLPAGSPVTVEGVVTMDEGVFAPRNVFVQDATGGILVFIQAADRDLGLKIGDSIRVSGAIRFFNDEVQISDNPIVEVLGTGTPPTPRPITGAQFLARTFEGQVAALGRVRVDSIATFATALNVFATTADGSVVTLRSDNRTGLSAANWTEGDTYEVTGILRSFRGTPQFFPRRPQDVVRVDDTGTGGGPSIAQARTFAVGTEVTVEGVVTVREGAFAARNVFIQDATGGILVFLQAADVALALQVGDSIRVSGEIRLFNDEIQISNNPVVEVLGTGTPPTPRLVTGAQVLARTFEGELAEMGPVTVDSIATFATALNVFVTAADGSVVTIRSDNRTGLTAANWTPGTAYDVVGILRSFRGTPQFFPRSPADVAPVPEGPSIAEIRGFSSGTEVTVEGIVTVNEGSFAARNIFIQDRTGGILVFIQTADVALGLKVGDRIRVSGEIRFFNDEIQISNNPTIEVLGTGTPPAPRPVTGAEVLARTFEGELAEMGPVTVDSIATFATALNVFVTAADGSVVTIRSDNRTGLTVANWTVGERYRVTGILRSFRGTPQFFPRQPEDVTPAGAPFAAGAARPTSSSNSLHVTSEMD
jgi:DNA/RNA endonuclease YhcR with UshA esterase domain